MLHVGQVDAQVQTTQGFTEVELAEEASTEVALVHCHVKEDKTDLHVARGRRCLTRCWRS